MAVFPCDWVTHRYPGQQRSAYMTSVFGDDMDTTKMRLCERHFGEMRLVVLDNMAIIDEDSQASRLCDQCGEEKVWSVYLKMFDKGSDPVDHAADLCSEHYDLLREHLHMSHGRPL